MDGTESPYEMSPVGSRRSYGKRRISTAAPYARSRPSPALMEEKTSSWAWRVGTVAA